MSHSWIICGLFNKGSVYTGVGRMQEMTVEIRVLTPPGLKGKGGSRCWILEDGYMGWVALVGAMPFG